MRRLMHLLGALLLAGVLYGGLAFFHVPPGTVVQRNLDEGVDATPLFYSEVEHMATLEQGVAHLRAAGDSLQADSTLAPPEG